MKNRFLCIIMTVILLPALLAGCGNGAAGSTGQTPDISSEALDLSSELVSLKSKDNILKIDCITPGLDTMSMRTVLYSVKEQKKLCEVEFSENTWDSGQISDGFYAVSLTENRVYIYDTAGKLTADRSIDAGGCIMAFAALSDDGSCLIYGNSQSAEIIIYSMDENTGRTIGSFEGYIDTLGYTDGYFYLKNSDGELMRVAPDGNSLEKLYSDRRINFITQYYGTGTGEYSFIVADAKNKSIRYVPFFQVDEIVIAAGSAGFISCVSKSDGDLLRAYNVDRKCVYEIAVSGQVSSAVYTDNNQLAVITHNSEAGTNKLYFHKINSGEKKDITVSDSDNAVQAAVVESPPQAYSEVTDTDNTRALRIGGVPILAQMPEYPTGCESVSAVMALKFCGEQITVAKFIDQYLDKSSDFYYAGGLHYGPNPFEYFIGSPRSNAAYGCMAPVIEKALISYFGTDKYIKNVTGTPLKKLCSDYIDNGTPVIVWASIYMMETYPGNSWRLQNGDVYTWPANEHCMLLTGYDEDNYYFNDPYTGKAVKYEKSLSEERYAELGSQSLVIVK